LFHFQNNHVLIIGAGISGLTAAHQMNHFGIKVRYIYKLNKNANPRARNLWTSKAGFGQVKIMKEFV
jgi:2-polyprenyl-6-methoxyphenol hydroxylase-like FAD-dependent oxidoreductase